MVDLVVVEEITEPVDMEVVDMEVDMEEDLEVDMEEDLEAVMEADKVEP